MKHHLVNLYQVITFLPININNPCVSGAQKNPLETVLLDTHNIYIDLEIRNIIFNYTLLSGGLTDLIAFRD